MTFVTVIVTVVTQALATLVRLCTSRSRMSDSSQTAREQDLRAPNADVKDNANALMKGSAPPPQP